MSVHRIDDTLGVTLVCQRSSVVQHLDSNVGETVTTEPYPRDSMVCHNHKPTFGKHLRQKRSCEDLVIENKGETLPLLNWYNNLEKHLRQNSEVKISQDDAAFGSSQWNEQNKDLCFTNKLCSNINKR